MNATMDLRQALLKVFEIAGHKQSEFADLEFLFSVGLAGRLAEKTDNGPMQQQIEDVVKKADKDKDDVDVLLELRSAFLTYGMPQVLEETYREFLLDYIGSIEPTLSADKKMEMTNLKNSIK